MLLIHHKEQEMELNIRILLHDYLERVEDVPSNICASKSSNLAFSFVLSSSISPSCVG